MTFRILLISSLLAVTTTTAIAAESSGDSHTNPTAETNKSEGAKKPATKPVSRHDHAAERLGGGTNPSAPPAAEDSMKPEEEKKARHDHMRDMK
ncbi:hypothetical protein [Aromatoleum evansii]|uniref:hypothetical protein n=1 Tax=Aromatoleum evansii TaxID=59406 RepID=UPI00145DF161|nr:hypothetical protein [Aromatoleum evansii]NMG29980.1 hypothetical protein [Aromatoleum evansii]